MPVRVLGTDREGTIADLASGITWAAENGAKVINMSLGGSSSPTLSQAVQLAESKGVVMVAASGNDSSSSVSYPAAYSQVIAVGAASGYDPFTVAAFSNGGAGLT